MTHVIRVRNVNHALSEGLHWLSVAGRREQSRNGEVIVAPAPVITEYLKPCERVLFNAARNANPFFHLMEALWMLAGRNDLTWPVQFNSRFVEYSDDGKTIHGAYGYRWRKQFGIDQIATVISILQRKPETRQAVMGMWTPELDTYERHKDIPCNTQIYFDLRSGALNMTVLCRSNDIIWGAYGANVVHMSMLQEFIAVAVGVPVGIYRQFSNNYHLYTGHYDIHNEALRRIDDAYAYMRTQIIQPYPLMQSNYKSWLADLDVFMATPGAKGYKNEDPFFACVARPMYSAWMTRKQGLGTGCEEAKSIVADDWRLACVEWIKRAEKRRLKNDKGE